MTMKDAVFTSEMLEALLSIDEGPTLDFKQEQYPFEEEPAEVKSTVTTVATEVQLDPPPTGVVCDARRSLTPTTP